ncbi:MAG: hypothetical protein IJG09_09905 [Methanobrevibacter sp.]|nr:hypothetical protein [Methanobrevibacter sp.]
MANITKNQIKKRLREIVALLEQAKELVNDLSIDVEEEKDNIEPYDNKDDLTPQQEERQDYLSELFDTLDTQSDNIDDITSELDNFIY